MAVAFFLGGLYWAGLLTREIPVRGDPETTTRIAMTGYFDIEGDGIQDLGKVKKSLERDCGSVVAYQDTDGSFHGKIDGSIQFLVIGKSARSDSDKFILAAEKYNVPTIHYEKLLNRLPRGTTIERLNENEWYKPRRRIPTP